MPTKEAQIEMIANQMMKGSKGGALPGTPEQRKLFQQEHQSKIEWVSNQLPRCSAAVGAVLVKTALRYGDEPVERFCKALKSQNFNGSDDPSYLLWKFLSTPGNETKTIYKKTLCAVKAFVKGEKLKAIREGKGDILKWDGEKFVIPSK